VQKVSPIATSKRKYYPTPEGKIFTPTGRGNKTPDFQPQMDADERRWREE
jgi:hypothetical protein